MSVLLSPSPALRGLPISFGRVFRYRFFPANLKQWGLEMGPQASQLKMKSLSSKATCFRIKPTALKNLLPPFNATKIGYWGLWWLGQRCKSHRDSTGFSKNLLSWADWMQTHIPVSMAQFSITSLVWAVQGHKSGPSLGSDPKWKDCIFPHHGACRRCFQHHVRRAASWQERLTIWVAWGWYSAIVNHYSAFWVGKEFPWCYLDVFLIPTL